MSVLEGGWECGWGEAGSWLLLPTRPQRYCDPASLVFVRERPVTRGASGVGIGIESFLLFGESTPSTISRTLYIYTFIHIKRVLRRMDILWR